MDVQDFTPLGGGRVSKAQAFEAFADALNLYERPISNIRRDVFRLAFDLGRHAFEHLGEGVPGLGMWLDSWDTIGGLYEALATIEDDAMRPTWTTNLDKLLAERAAAEQAA